MWLYRHTILYSHLEINIILNNIVLLFQLRYEIQFLLISVFAFMLLSSPNTSLCTLRVFLDYFHPNPHSSVVMLMENILLCGYWNLHITLSGYLYTMRSTPNPRTHNWWPNTHFRC